MRANPRTSIVLAALALGLLLFIVFVERGTVSTSEREGRKGRVLDSFVRERVSKLELQRKGTTTVLTRVPVKQDDPLDVGGWRVEKPYAARADQSSVDSLLGALEWLDARRSLGELSPKELASFGLTKPRYRVAFVVGDDRVAFSIGGPAADGGAYLQLQGKPLAYVVGKDVVEALDHEPTDFHSKELHEGVSMLTLIKCELADASGKRTIERKQGFDWLTSAFVSMAAAPAVTAVINGLDGLRASRFVADKPKELADYGLGAPTFTLSLDSKAFDKSAKDKSRVDRLDLRVGNACSGHAGESYLRVNQGPIFCAADSELAPLKKRAEELRETRLLPLEDSEIHGVKIRAGQVELVLDEADKETRYRVLAQGRETKRGKVDPAALADWYKALRGLAIERFETGRDATSARPESVRATFERGKGQPTYTLRLIDDPSGLAAVRMDETVLLRVPPRVRELLSASAVRFRAKRVIDEDEGCFTKLVLTRPGNVVETVTKSANGYQLSGPCAAAAQRSSVDDILRLASKLDAVRFVAEGASPEHGFNSPYRSLRLEYRSDTTAHVHTLLLGAALGDEGRFAKLDDDPTVLLVSNALVQKLEDPLVSRDAPALPLDQLESFDIGVGQRHVRVERQGDAFVMTGEGQANSARADRLARALATLHAARVVSYGKPNVAEGVDRPELRVVAKLKDGREPTLQFGAAAPGDTDNPQVFVRRSGLDVTFQVPRTALDALLERTPPKGPG
jgi:hypothetical protein